MTFFVDESVIMKEKDNEIQWISSDYSKQLYYEIKTIADKYKIKMKIICLGNTDENKNFNFFLISAELSSPTAILSSYSRAFLKRCNILVQIEPPQ